MNDSANSGSLTPNGMTLSILLISAATSRFNIFYEVPTQSSCRAVLEGRKVSFTDGMLHIASVPDRM